MIDVEIVKAEKDFKCIVCNGIIRDGQLYRYETIGDDDCREEYRMHANKNCSGVLLNAPNISQCLKKCNKGDHEWEEDVATKWFSDGSSIPLYGETYTCKNCGASKKPND